MRDSACRWLIVENAEVFCSYVKHFEFSHMKEIVESWLVYVKKFSWIIQSCFLTEAIKKVSASFFFLLFRALMKGKQILVLKML